MKFSQRSRLLAILLLLLTGCAQTSVANQPKVSISIAGSTTFFPVLFDLTQAFSERYPNVVFDVRGGGSSFGENQLAQGKIDLATTSYLIAKEDDPPVVAGPNALVAGAPITHSIEQNSAATTNFDLTLRNSVQVPIGLDGVAIIVNQNNPIVGVTLNELRDIYGGRILDWDELEADAGEIQLVIREDGSGVQELFESRVMQDKQISLTAVIMPSNADVLSYVALYPSAIGYISRGYVMQSDDEIATSSLQRVLSGTGDAVESADGADDASSINSLTDQIQLTNSYLQSLSNELSQVKVISIDDHLPTRSKILEQQYYLVYPLYLTAAEEPSGWLSTFIDFVLSPSGQEIVGHYHAPVR